MKKEEFESKFLDLWMTTSIPMTLANVQYFSGAPRRKLTKWLDEMVAEDMVEMDSDDSGEMLFHVRGADRPANGPRTFAELTRYQALQGEVSDRLAKAAARQRLIDELRQREKKSAAVAVYQRDALEDLHLEVGKKAAMGLARRARAELTRPTGQGEKSVIASGALSLFLGPLGWFYAGAWREALLGSAAYLVAAKIIPTLLFLPLLTILMPISGLAGLAYALQYNRNGQRTPLLGSGDKDD